MIELPWQIVACAVAWLCITQAIYYLRHSDCEEQLRAARNEERRLTIAAYRDTYRRAWRQALQDARHSRDQEIRRIVSEMKDDEKDTSDA